MKIIVFPNNIDQAGKQMHNSGFGLYGVDVFVDDADRERAMEIIGGTEDAVYD